MYKKCEFKRKIMFLINIQSSTSTCDVFEFCF